MSLKDEFDVLIAGGGLAGSLCALHLMEHSLRVGIIDHHQPGVGASSNPASLLNPIPGATLNPKPGSLRAHAFTSAWLQSLPSHVRCHIRTDLQLLRPFDLSIRTGRRLKRSFEESAPIIRNHIHAELLSAADLKRTYPLLDGCDGAVLLQGAATAPLACLLSHVKAELSKGPAKQLGGRLLDLEPNQRGWHVKTSCGNFDTAKVVLALGSGLPEIFPALPFRQTAGHLAVVDLPGQFPRGFAVSGRGHLAPLADGTWSLGATYHQEDSPEPQSDIEVLELLIAKLGTWIPRLQDAKIARTWRGVRGVLPPERQPVVGPVPGSHGLFVHGGFASRGLQWIPWTSRALADHVLGAALDVPDTILPDRFSEAVWER